MHLTVTVDERQTIRAFELTLFDGDERLCVMDTVVNGCDRTAEKATSGLALKVQVDTWESITRLVYQQASLQLIILHRASVSDNVLFVMHRLGLVTSRGRATI